jgi:hypothetical protein
MSLDIWLTAIRPTVVFDANITHNLGQMAEEAGIYTCLWHPEDAEIKTAGDLIAPLREGLALMESDPARFKAFNAPNRWGLYKHFVPWLKKLLEACEQNPDATIDVSI